MRHETLADRVDHRAPDPDMGDMHRMVYALSSIFDLMVQIDDGHLDNELPKHDLENTRAGLAIAGELICDDFKRRF